jgi:UDP-N-acetylglucosamine 1-carboxyvinyltransferase
VGATENAILASVFAEGITIITNVAREPEIVDLQNFLNKMGAKVNGAGSDIIEIEGVKKLKEISYNIMPDRIETGTFLCLAAATNGNLIVKNTEPLCITPIIDKLEETECKVCVEKKDIKIMAPKKLKSIDIKTMPYPGFPTDLQSIFGAMLTTAKGTSVIVENIFESRFKYTQELIRMGAKITVEGRSAIIKGTKKLYGANVSATDLRGGVALVIAGLMAKGITTVNDIEYILRGYENFEQKLKDIGAKIKLENN